MHFRDMTRSLMRYVIALLVLGGFWAAPAAAYTQRLSGRPGRVIAYQVQGSHHQTPFCQPNGACFTYFQPWVVGTGPVVYRSRATSGRQTINAQYNLLRWNGSAWENWSQRNYSLTLRRGYSRLRLPRIDFLSTRAGYFQVRTAIQWVGPRRVLGGRGIRYTQRGDYICNTRYPCQAGAGWIWLRSPSA